MLLVLLLALPCVSWCRDTLEVEPAVTFPHPGYSKLSWFVHITDIHVSSWEDDTRQEQVRWEFSSSFCVFLNKIFPASA